MNWAEVAWVQYETNNLIDDIIFRGINNIELNFPTVYKLTLINRITYALLEFEI